MIYILPVSRCVFITSKSWSRIFSREQVLRSPNFHALPQTQVVFLFFLTVLCLRPLGILTSPLVPSCGPVPSFPLRQENFRNPSPFCVTSFFFRSVSPSVSPSREMSCSASLFFLIPGEKELLFLYLQRPVFPLTDFVSVLLLPWLFSLMSRRLVLSQYC